LLYNARSIKNNFGKLSTSWNHSKAHIREDEGFFYINKKKLIAQRDGVAAQVVAIRGLAAVGHTVKMLAEGKFIGIPVKQESPGF
jgi:hypothetical protein